MSLAQFNEARIANAEFLSDRLAGVTTPIVPEERKHVFHQYTIRVGSGRRDSVQQRLREKGIGTGVYYPVPVHKQRQYLDGSWGIPLPEAEKAAAEVLSLPVHPALSKADLDTIMTAVNELCGQDHDCSQ